MLRNETEASGDDAPAETWEATCLRRAVADLSRDLREFVDIAGREYNLRLVLEEQLSECWGEIAKLRAQLQQTQHEMRCPTAA